MLRGRFSFDLMYFILISAIVASAKANDALNEEVDGYVQKWYSKKLSIKIPLNEIQKTWESGIIIKDKKTLRCNDGFLDLQGSDIHRVSDATYVKSNSTRRAWVSAELALSPKSNFYFNDCVLQGDKTKVAGPISGNMMTKYSSVDLVFSYRAVWWWCEVNTLSLKLREDKIQTSLDNNGDIMKNLLAKESEDVSNLVTFSLASSATKAWEVLVGKGPDCPDSKC